MRDVWRPQETPLFWSGMRNVPGVCARCAQRIAPPGSLVGSLPRGLLRSPAPPPLVRGCTAPRAAANVRPSHAHARTGQGGGLRAVLDRRRNVPPSRTRARAVKAERPQPSWSRESNVPLLAHARETPDREGGLARLNVQPLACVRARTRAERVVLTESGTFHSRARVRGSRTEMGPGVGIGRSMLARACEARPEAIPTESETFRSRARAREVVRT